MKRYWIIGLLILASMMLVLVAYPKEKGYALRFLDETEVVFNHDTVSIQRMDSLRFVLYNKADSCQWLMEKRDDGLYYPLYKCRHIDFVSLTTDYVVAYNEEDSNGVAIDPWLYRLHDGRKLMCCNDTDFCGYVYVGKVDTLDVFRNLCDIWGTNGKRVRLKNPDADVFIDNQGKVLLNDGGMQQSVTINELFNHHPSLHSQTLRDTSLTYIDRYITDPNVLSNAFYVEASVEYPHGNTADDRAIRNWMSQLMFDEIFSSMLDDGVKEKPVLNPTNLEAVLQQYATQFFRLYKKVYGSFENGKWMVGSNFTTFSIKRVMETERFVTYGFSGTVYWGGAHGAPHGFFRTYDKQNHCFLDHRSIVKKGKEQQVLNLLEKHFFVQKKRRSGDETLANYYDANGGDPNVCASWSGTCEKSSNKYDSATLFQHMAVMPQGIVGTLHPYQAGCFADGEFHVLVPYKELKDCLQIDVSKEHFPLPTLSHFLDE